jgi:uncharacterized delta-60 repeat protein
MKHILPALRRLSRSCTRLCRISALLVSIGLAAAAVATTLPADRVDSPSMLQIDGRPGNFALRSVRDANDRVLTVGYCLNANGVQQYCISRLNSNMTADSTFGAPQGTPTPGGVMIPVAFFGIGRAVAIQKDGKILFGGYCHDEVETFVSFCVVRLTNNGLIDNSFGNSGVVRQRVDAAPVAHNFAEAMLLQADGKILLAGQCGEGAAADFCFMRLTPEGALDSSFTGPTGTAGGAFRVPMGNGYDYLADIAIDPVDGKISGAGTCEYEPGKVQRCIVRLTTTGAFDTQFNAPSTPGRLFLAPFAVGGNDGLAAITLQTDGKIVVGGRCEATSIASAACYSRITTSGALDSSGSISGDPHAAINRITVARDGKILFGGECNGDFCLFRLQPDFTLDRSFVSNPDENNAPAGFVQFVGSSGRSLATGLDIQNDGKIVVTGQCAVPGGMNFCAARLYGGPQSFRHCSRDVDGDGRIDATDAILISRVLFGLTGDAVLSGIVFRTEATRRSWPQIRDHLANQCALSISPN